MHISLITRFFREDLQWRHFGAYLKERYKEDDKVHTLIWGCLEGAEAYSLSMVLQQNSPNDYENFFRLLQKIYLTI